MGNSLGRDSSEQGTKIECDQHDYVETVMPWTEQSTITRIGPALAFVLPLVTSTGCTRKPLPEPPRGSFFPSYCATLQEHLRRTASTAGLNVDLRCLETPELVGLGFAGTRDAPTERRLASYVNPGEAKAMVSVSEPIEFHWSYNDKLLFSADGGLDLTTLGTWAPKLKGEGVKDRNVHVSLHYEDVRFMRVSDVGPILGRSKHPNVYDIIDYMCADEKDAERIYTSVVLSGKLVLTVQAAAAKITAADAGIPNALEFSMRRTDKQGYQAKLVSKGRVTIAAVLAPSRPMMLRSNNVCDRKKPAVLHQIFYPDGDAGQCNGAAFGHVSAPMGEWMPFVALDTDNRGGGCFQQFGITDPDNVLQGLSLSVDFHSDGGDGQCDSGDNAGHPITITAGAGNRPIPISVDGVRFSEKYRINTDNRGGGCFQTFSLSGRDDVAFDVEFIGNEQCGGDTGRRTVTSQNPVKLWLDMDNRPGGCLQRFRLRFKD